MLEADFETDVVAYCADRGILALKLKIEGERGWPDRTLFVEGGIVVLLELKRHARGSRTSYQQRRWIEKLRGMGFVAEVCRTISDVERAIASATKK